MDDDESRSTLSDNPGQPFDAGGPDESPRFVELDSMEPDQTIDGEEIDPINPAGFIRGFDGDGYALATVDEKTGVWFLHRSTGIGGLMRTRGTTTAMLWRSPDAARAWLDNLPDRSKADLTRRPIFIVPVKLVILFNGTFERVIITTRPVPPEPGADPDAAAPRVEFELNTVPLKKRRRRKRKPPNRHAD